MVVNFNLEKTCIAVNETVEHFRNQPFDLKLPVKTTTHDIIETRYVTPGGPKLVQWCHLS